MNIEHGDQLLVHFIEQPSDKIFQSDYWPLHVTLLPWFRVAQDRQDELHDELRIIARRTEIILARAEEMADFGSKKHSLPVRLLGVEAFRTIHFRMSSAVTRLGGKHKSPAFIGADFRPHVTEQGHRTVEAEQEIKVDEFSLVEKVDTPRGDREVIQTFRLEG